MGGWRADATVAMQISTSHDGWNMRSVAGASGARAGFAVQDANWEAHCTQNNSCSAAQDAVAAMELTAGAAAPPDEQGAVRKSGRARAPSARMIESVQATAATAQQPTHSRAGQPVQGTQSAQLALRKLDQQQHNAQAPAKRAKGAAPLSQKQRSQSVPTPRAHQRPAFLDEYSDDVRNHHLACC